MTQTRDHSAVRVLDTQTMAPVHHTNCEAVYWIGRELNRLRFHLAQAWLFISRDDANQARVAVQELRLRVLQVGWACSTADQLATELLQLKSGFATSFGSEAHGQCLEEAQREIIGRIGTEELILVQRELVRWIVARWNNAIDELISRFDAILGHEAQQFLRLGLHVDQAFRPWPLEDCLRVDAQPAPSTASLPACDNGSAPPSLGEAEQCDEDNRSEIGLPDVPISDYCPPPRWWSECEVRYREIASLDHVPFPATLQPPTTCDAVHPIVTRLDGCVRDACAARQQEEHGDDTSDEVKGDDEDQDGHEREDNFIVRLNGRLKLSNDGKYVIFDETRYATSLLGWRAFRLIALEDGHIISSSDMGKVDAELELVRVDRKLRKLPPEIFALIDRVSTGYRLKIN